MSGCGCGCGSLIASFDAAKSPGDDSGDPRAHKEHKKRSPGKGKAYCDGHESVTNCSAMFAWFEGHPLPAEFKEACPERVRQIELTHLQMATVGRHDLNQQRESRVEQQLRPQGMSNEWHATRVTDLQSLTEWDACNQSSWACPPQARCSCSSRS